MTDERRAEVNKRLAQWEDRDFDRAVDEAADNLFVTTAEAEAAKVKYTYRGADYTTDLNALLRLETKLPRHQWTIWYGYELEGDVSLQLIIRGVTIDALSLSTETQARAEAIYRYLTSQDKEQADG